MIQFTQSYLIGVSLNWNQVRSRQMAKCTVLGEVCIRGRRLSRFPWYEETRSILVPPGKDATISQGYPQYYIRQFTFIHRGWKEVL